ncbi:hypothetical protein BC938DRAFT_473393 [Jimgerdemannia flammicorona]|uniref:Uncharacterized protein n=1 Tax=Jimgerdemannia flammicorona TaxID=994334 RepID=A0A433Q417_9FUNG|nr:hypothetical protein BC938DRAFT_473393 [Jimgerdemannia flammicorona]
MSRDDGLLCIIALDEDKSNHQNGTDDEEGDDEGAVPGVIVTAPFDGKQDGDAGNDQNEGAQEVNTVELVTHRALGLGKVEEEKDDGDGDGANGKVDVEVPPPADVVEQLLTCDHGHGHDSATTDALEGAEDNKHDHVLRHTAEDGSDFEDDDCEQEGNLATEDIAELAVKRLECRRSQHVSCADPTNLVERIKIRGDAR